MTYVRYKPASVLVIGAGPAAVAMHLPQLVRLRDAGLITLALVCDLEPRRAAAAREQFAFRESSGDARRALARDDIEAVYILASAQLHYEYGLAALQSGKHLFVEKPVAPSYAQACEMAQAAQAQGLIAVGAHNRRFYRSLLEACARAGKARWPYAEVVFHKPEFGKPVPFGARTWLSANGIHALDALVFAMGGLPEHLTARVSGSPDAPPSRFSALMSWPDGAQGTFLCNNDAGLRREEYAFHTLGETWTVTEHALTIAGDNGTVRNLARPTIGDGIAAEHDAFIHAIRAGSPPVHALRSIAPSLLLAELIEGGFVGEVRVPDSAVKLTSRPCHSHLQTAVLVTQSLGLQLALVRHLAGYRLVSLEDVQGGGESHPDVVAAILGHGSPALPPDILQKLPALRVVGVAGLSLARHAPETLLARGITLVNASQSYADSVAEFALGLAILGRRRAFISHEAMRRGGWGTRLPLPALARLLQRIGRRADPILVRLGLGSLLPGLRSAAGSLLSVPDRRASTARELRGALVGLIGWSANARAFTERLLRSGARVTVYSQHAERSDIISAGATPVSFAEALAAEIVSLHRGLNAETCHFLGTAELERLRPGSVLINIARGPLIEPHALLERLKRGDVFACLDTYELEPLPRSHPLRQLPNVFLTSHIAGGSSDMHCAAADEVVRKVAAVLAGEGDVVQVIAAQRLRTMT